VREEGVWEEERERVAGSQSFSSPHSTFHLLNSWQSNPSLTQTCASLRTTATVHSQTQHSWHSHSRSRQTCRWTWTDIPSIHPSIPDRYQSSIHQRTYRSICARL